MFRLADSSDDEDERGTSSVPFPSAASPLHDHLPRAAVPRTTSTPVLLPNGKPLKSSLKSSSSSPSLVLPPRTRSEPSTPLLAPKNVHFPEGDLVSVRVFNRSARPASLSKPVGDDTETETETDNSNIVWPAASASSYFRSVAAKSAKKAFQLNTETCSTVPRKHEQLDLYANVHLEGIQLKSSPTASPAVTGSILVRNVAYEKTVVVRFTLDGWQTTSEVSARHQASLAGLPNEFLRSSAPASYGLTIGDLAAKSPEWDRFSFTIKLEDYAQNLEQKTMWLVVRYNVPSWGDDSPHEWWDNNGGTDYKIGFRAAHSTPSTLPKLSFPIARSVSASAAVPSLHHQKFFSYPHTATPTPRRELPAYPYHRTEAPQPEREKLLQDQHAQHQTAVAQTTLNRLKKLNLRNYAAPSPTASPIVSPHSSPVSSRRSSVSTSSAESVDVVAITSSGSSSASTSGSSTETTPMSSPKTSFLGLGLGQNERKPYAGVDLEFGLDLGMQFQDGAPATTSAPISMGMGIGAVEWLGTSPPFSMLSSQGGFPIRSVMRHHDVAPPSAPAPTPTHPPRRVRKHVCAASSQRRVTDSSSSDTDRGATQRKEQEEEEELEQLQRTPRPPLLSSAPSPHHSRSLLSGVNVLLDEIKEKNTSSGSQRKNGRGSPNSGSGSGSGSRSGSGSGSSSGSSSSSDSESNGPIYTRSSSPRRTQTQTHSPPPQPPPVVSSSPGGGPLPSPPQPSTPDSVYQAFVRQWCFAQGGPGSPGLGVIVR